ncbi:AAA ATPase-like protein [Flavobacterium sp. 9]|uniref:AAA family ATPase n=1 Tax=Flavobacterium sp. 9 TaxID=2035198 RepID=UPI000C1A5784|nr:AAA family ATPase [Flavobacterium sp. 9]PIF33221.1 AAA ATPase-like protein [Flavobacterium sp. 9]
MERAKLIVKNFGPLKDIDIEIREMVTFIGAQASGKSTLAKLISIFEDDDFRRISEATFEAELRKYNIYSYLNENTFIQYKNSESVYPFTLRFSSNKFEKQTITNIIELFKGIKNEDHDIIKDKTIENFKFLIEGSIKHSQFYDVNFETKILNLFPEKKQKTKFINYYFNPENEQFFEEHLTDEILDILCKEKKFENYLQLYEALVNSFSNIFIYDSIYIPTERNILDIISTNVLGLINNNIQIPKYLLNSGQEYEKAIQTIKELPLNIIDKKIKYKREGKSSYIYHNETEKVDLLESASGLQSIIPILLLVEYSKSLKEKYNFNFVVEEPELNLYPKAQHELIKYLVKNCLFDRKNLILTTHSPFILASLNNLLLAYDKGKKNPKEVNKIIKKESWLNPKNFIAYELKNGKAKKIMNDKLGQISENMIDGVSDAFANEFDKLLDL